LLLQPASSEYRYKVRSSEPLRYAKRERLSEQSWLRFPVSGVSWEDAQAYVAWLDESGRVPHARLCTEYEWERAARGADAREYPHGNRLDPEDANFDQTYGREAGGFGPDEVGAHPASSSPFGVEDLAGNIHEWVVNSLSEKRVAVRGGSFYFGRMTARLNNHAELEATMRNITQGLRVCATPRPVK
jgi:formylglycine-generating enzyme required for sulfatase activity